MRLTRGWRRNKNSMAGAKDRDPATPMSQRKVMNPIASHRLLASSLAKDRPSSLTTSAQTAGSKEFHCQSQTETKDSKLDVEKANTEDVNDREGCLLFHDSSHSNEHDVEDEDGKDGVENDNISINVEQLMKPPDLVAPATPNSRYHNGNIANGPPSNLFLPPREVTIDPDAVPPSPMRDPSVAFVAHQEDQGLLLNLGNPQQHCAQQQCQFQEPEVLGDPVGDIAMKRQILDAQRLVRVILGKSHSGVGEHQPLETSNILHAIRSFALMKQELIDLRKRQEVAEGDPPSILQALGSPATSATTTNGTKTPRTAASANPSPRDGGYVVGLQKQQDDSDQNSPSSESWAVIALNEAKTQIECLEEKLSAANKTILKLKSEKILGRDKQVDGATFGFAAGDTAPTPQQFAKQDFDLDMKYACLLRDHKMSVDESKRNLDLVLEEVASVPKRVLAKDSIREKLKVYVQTIAQQTSKLEQMELHAELQKSQEVSQARIHALEERLKRQEENHQQQLAMVKGTRESVTIQEDTRASTAMGKESVDNKGSVFSRIQGLLFESQPDVEILTQQIQDSQLGLGLGNGNNGETQGVDGAQQEHLVLKEFSQNRSIRIPTATARKREMEDEKKIDL